jgi:hypothetical protein
MSLIDYIVQRRLIKLNKRIENLQKELGYYELRGELLRNGGNELDESDRENLAKLVGNLNKLFSFKESLNYGGSLKCRLNY